jgi:transcriptional regulator with XRE-family HTH domain
MEASLKPKYRFKLRGAIITSGYKNLSEFAESIGSSGATLSTIINGWRFPSPEFQRKIASALEISITELKKLL